jgi:hypothetical protein
MKKNYFVFKIVLAIGFFGGYAARATVGDVGVYTSPAKSYSTYPKDEAKPDIFGKQSPSSLSKD